MVFDFRKKQDNEIEARRKAAERRRRKRRWQQFLLALVGLLLVAAIVWVAVFFGETMEQLSADLSDGFSVLAEEVRL